MGALGPWEPEVEDNHMPSLKVVQMKSEVKLVWEVTKTAEAR